MSNDIVEFSSNEFLWNDFFAVAFMERHVCKILFVVKYIFCQIYLLSNNISFVKYIFCQIYILSNIFIVKYIFFVEYIFVKYIFVEYIFCRMYILSNIFFVEYIFCRIYFLSNIFFVKYIFCQIYFFVKYTFCRIYFLGQIYSLSNIFLSNEILLDQMSNINIWFPSGLPYPLSLIGMFVRTHSGLEWNQTAPKWFVVPYLAADSSGALKCSLFYLLCSPYRLNNEMLTILWQICLKTAKTSPQEIVIFLQVADSCSKIFMNG